MSCTALRPAKVISSVRSVAGSSRITCMGAEKLVTLLDADVVGAVVGHGLAKKNRSRSWRFSGFASPCGSRQVLPGRQRRGIPEPEKYRRDAKHAKDVSTPVRADNARMKSLLAALRGDRVLSCPHSAALDATPRAAYGSSSAWSPARSTRSCLKLAKGQSKRFEWTANANVDFNIHYHKAKPPTTRSRPTTARARRRASRPNTATITAGCGPR